MERKRYHEKVWMPKLPPIDLALVYGNHALTTALDRNLADALPKVVNLGAVRIVELDTFTNAKGKEVIEKVLVRVDLGDGWDLCMPVMQRPGQPWLVKTVWANRTDDNHATLQDAWQFEKRPKKAV